MNVKIFISLFLFFTFYGIQAQVNFTKVDNFIENGNTTFLSILTDDFNNDLVDDILFFENGSIPHVHLNNRLGRDWKKIVGPALPSQVWGAVSVDLNNDGYKEIICGTIYENVRIYTFNHDAFSFELYQELPSNIFIQNINAVDINMDGFSDIFICNDLGENHFYLNDNGQLSFHELIDFSTEPADLAGGNYASQFVDFDLDGDQDLYVTKCSAFALAGDPRRINQLFINDGKGNFTEVGAQFNIDTDDQSWVSDFADLDLDGDLDLVVLNHYADLQLFENINNETFVEVQEGSGLKLQDFFFQIALQDVNNDGFEDIILTESTVEVYLNNGDFTFEKVDFNNVKPAVSSSFSVGDYNKDGKMDICAKSGSFNAIKETEMLIQNENEENNNWINFHLEGVSDSKDALGVRIELFSSNQIQNRIKRYGRSYGVQFSNQLHFGLGNSSIVDSIRIYWLTGEPETLYNLEPNTHHYIKQKDCNTITQVYEVLSDAECINDVLVLEHNSEEFTQWNTGETSPVLNTTIVGEYFSMYTANDCMLNSWKSYSTEKSIVQQQEDRFMLDTLGLLPCENEELVLRVNDDEAIWNDSVVSSDYVSNSSDPIHVVYTENCIEYDVTFERFDITYDFTPPETEYLFSGGEDIFVEVGNEEAEWFFDVEDLPFHTGEAYTFLNVTQERDFQILNTKTYTHKIQLGIDSFSNAINAPSNINYKTTFIVHEKINFETFRVKTDVPGFRTFEVRRENNILIKELEEFIPQGETAVEIDIILDPGVYTLGTNAAQNMMSFNSTGPWFYKEQNEDNPFPFKDELGYAEIIDSEGEVLHFYYDWTFSVLNEKECIDGYYPSRLKSISSIGGTEAEKLTYNSLVTDELRIDFEGNHTLFIYDSAGKLMARKGFENETLFGMIEFPSGVYYMVIEKGVYKIVKQ